MFFDLFKKNIFKFGVLLINLKLILKFISKDIHRISMEKHVF